VRRERWSVGRAFPGVNQKGNRPACNRALTSARLARRPQLAGWPLASPPPPVVHRGFRQDSTALLHSVNLYHELALLCPCVQSPLASL